MIDVTYVAVMYARSFVRAARDEAVKLALVGELTSLDVA
jgi:hypothetical protein